MAYRQRSVFVGTVCQRLVDEEMTRGTADHFEHMGVGQPFFVEPLNQTVTCALRGHPRAVQQAVLSAVYHSTFSSQLSRP